MDIAKKIKMAITYAGISEAKLARLIESSPQSFNQRMKTNKWNGEDLEKIAAALGAQAAVEFRFPDGTVI